MGDIEFFEVALSVLSKVPLGSAQALIHDEERLGLRAISGHAGMSEALIYLGPGGTPLLWNSLGAKWRPEFLKHNALEGLYG